MSKKTTPAVKIDSLTPVECSFCNHVYLFPCNGERYDCANAVWKRSGGRIDFNRLSEEERAKIIKTGKIPANVTTHSARKAVEEAAKPAPPPAPSKPKRVRLS